MRARIRAAVSVFVGQIGLTTAKTSGVPIAATGSGRSERQ
jgi:hypothetical protein